MLHIIWIPQAKKPNCACLPVASMPTDVRKVAMIAYTKSVLKKSKSLSLLDLPTAVMTKG